MNTMIFLALSLLFPLFISAEIKEIHQFCEFENILGPLKNSDWVLFDIDYTLTEPSHPALQMRVIKQNKQRFRDELASFTDYQKLIVPLLMVTQFTNQLTDTCIPALIQKLKDKNIPVLGFTALDTASIPKIGSIPSWRIHELAKLGISFQAEASPFPKENFELVQFPSFQGTFPLYENGILYCNVTPSKGDVLQAFLIKLALTPSKIIFVDDSMENLQSVEAKLADLGIDFLGIHYKVIVDEASLPKVSDEDWRFVWDQIHERANTLSQIDNCTQKKLEHKY